MGVFGIDTFREPSLIPPDPPEPEPVVEQNEPGPGTATRPGGNEMATVYIVTHGDYSDYSILAVFSTRELAERFVAVYNQGDYAYDKAEIEEYELDCPPDNWVTYTVWFNEAGDVTYLSSNVSACSCTPRGPRFAYSYRDREAAQLAIEERVNDEQRAIKAAHEKWAAIKAAVPWGAEKALELLTRARRE